MSPCSLYITTLLTAKRSVTYHSVSPADYAYVVLQCLKLRKFGDYIVKCEGFPITCSWYGLVTRIKPL